MTLCSYVHTLDYHIQLHTLVGACLEYKAGHDGRRRKEIALVSRGNAGNRRISSNDLEDASVLRSISLRTRWKIFTRLTDF